jgi:S1-C subfamily serine protease
VYTKVQEQQPSSSAASSGNGYSVYFGSVPNFGSEVKGVLFDDVHADSPAGKAGLKAGDILVEFDGKAIQNLEDFTYGLQNKKPGDKVTVVVQRNGQPLKVNVTLQSRN